jgi:hypothetical protein
MMQAHQIFKALTDLGVTIRVDGTDLVVVPKSKVPDNLVSELRGHKAKLLALLTGVCFCKSPMPRADVENHPCQRCDLAGRCTVCGGCRWCAFQLKWNDNLLPKYRRRG